MNKKIKYVYNNYTSKKVRLGFIVILISSLIIQSLTLIPAILIGKISDGLNSGLNYEFFVNILIIYLLVEILASLVKLISERYDIQKVTFNFIEDFQSKTLRELGNKPMSFFMRGHTGKRISKMQKGFNALKNLIFETFFWIVPTAFLVITTIIFLFIKNHIFGFIALGVTILYGIGVALYWKNYKRPILKWNESGHRYFGEYSDLIRNSQEIKVASGQSLNIRHMYRKKKVHNHGKKMYWGMCTRETFLDLGGSISIIFVTALSVVMVKTGGLTTGDFFIMFLWFSRVVKNLGRSTGMLRNVMNNIASIDNLLDMLIETNDEIGGKSKTWLAKGSVEFNNVSYAYEKDDSDHALENISFNINPGSFVSFIGESGAGKSTIFKLLLQGIRPSNGSIKIGDGVDLSNMDPNNYLSQIAYIPQEKLLFDLSLRLNLTFGINEEVSDLKIYGVLERLGLSHLNNRLHKSIGENGRKLSGGERQRILFARALLKESANLILMDEPTSDLDAESEFKIREIIQEMKSSGKTIIMIAHRLTIVQDSDNIILLHKGKIKSTGNHKNLLENCSEYSQMVERQSVVV